MIKTVKALLITRRKSIQMFWFARLILIVLMALVTVDSYSLVNAQSVNRWSSQNRIPIYDDLIIRPPTLIVDSTGIVHAFNGQTVNDTAVIAYRRWSFEQGWTSPVDIILPPNNRLPARGLVLGLFLDQTGIIHMVFVSGDEFSSHVYYTKAPIVKAGQASAWAESVQVGEWALITPPQVRLSGDGQGNLIALYSGLREGHGLYVIESNDNGDTWTAAVPLFLTYSNKRQPSALTIYRDSQNSVHALWGVVGEEGLSEAIYYARLEYEQVTWSEPIEFDRAIGFQADAPAIVEFEGELFVTYHNNLPTTLWMRRSTDGGHTWTSPVRFAPGFVGSNGPVSYVVDSDNNLHAFFGSRTGNPAVHGMWHRIWQEDQWSDVTAVVSGPQIVDRIGGIGFDPNSAAAVVSRGNILLVVWITDGFARENGAWYAYTVLDTPQLSPITIPLPSPTLPPTETASPGAIAVSTPSLSLVLDETNYDESVSLSPVGPLFFGLMPVFLILVFVIILYRLRY